MYLWGLTLGAAPFFYAGRGEVVRVFINEEIGGEVLSCWKLWPRAGSRREPMLGP